MTYKVFLYTQEGIREVASCESEVNAQQEADQVIAHLRSGYMTLGFIEGVDKVVICKVHRIAKKRAPLFDWMDKWFPQHS
jgi:hypothetical protein